MIYQLSINAEDENLKNNTFPLFMWLLLRNLMINLLVTEIGFH